MPDIRDGAGFDQPAILLAIERRFDDGNRIKRDVGETRDRVVRLLKAEVEQHRIKVMYLLDARDALGQIGQARIAGVEPSLRPKTRDKFCRVASPARADVEQ